MACVYLCNNPAGSAHVPQNLKYKKRKKRKKQNTDKIEIMKETKENFTNAKVDI